MGEQENVPGTTLVETDKGSEAYFMQMREAAGGLSAHDYPDAHIRTIMKMAVPANASFSEAAGFLSICHQYRLNPILGQAFLAKSDDGKVKVLTGRDTFITLAESQDGYRGIANGVVYKGEKCVIQRNPKDPYEVWIDHEQNFEEHTQADIVGAYCIVYDKERPPLIIRRFWEDYKYLWSNDRKKNWRRSGTDMIENRAIAAALRRMYSLAGLLISGEEDSLGSGKGSESIIDDGSAADKLKAQLGEMEKANGIEVKQVWSAEVVITRGKHEGKRWMDLAEEDPGYVRKCATRRWLDLSAEDARMMHIWLDGEEGVESPQSDDTEPGVPEAQEEPETEETAAVGQLDQLHEDTMKVATELAKRGLLTSEESDEVDLLRHDGNVAGLEDLKEELERKLKGGEVGSTEGPQGGLWHDD